MKILTICISTNIIIIVLALFFAVDIAFSQKTTILLDSINVNNINETTRESTTKKTYSFYQDSVYNIAIKYQIPFLTRFYSDFMRSDSSWRFWVKQNDNTPWNNLKRIFESMPEEVFAPEGVELVQRQINIQNALSVPNGRGFNPSIGVVINDPWGKLGRILGIIEDVSPEISYNLTVTADVEIVIYSTQAIIIATIFSGTQKPGNYTITWNGRNDKGKKMPFGDYVAEIKIGADRFVRKRIVIE